MSSPCIHVWRTWKKAAFGGPRERERRARRELDVKKESVWIRLGVIKHMEQEQSERLHVY